MIEFGYSQSLLKSREFLYYLFAYSRTPSNFLLSFGCNNSAVSFPVMAGASLTKMCLKLSIQEEEKDKIVTDGDWMEAPIGQQGGGYLIGKLLLHKPTTAEGLSAVFHQVWKLRQDMLVQEVGDRLFVFQFADVLERDRVFVSQPWLFHKALLVLREFDGVQQPESITFETCPFWVKASGIPFQMRNERVGIAVGESMGRVLDVDVTSGRYLRIRIDMDLQRPFKTVTTLTYPNGESEIKLDYEKRPDYCWVCGLVDHQETECAVAVAMKIENRFAIQKYKPDKSESSFVMERASVTPVQRHRRGGAINRQGSQSVLAKSDTDISSPFCRHVDSMFLHGRRVARTLVYDDVSCEIISKMGVGAAEAGPEFRGGFENADPRGVMDKGALTNVVAGTSRTAKKGGRLSQNGKGKGCRAENTGSSFIPLGDNSSYESYSSSFESPYAMWAGPIIGGPSQNCVILGVGPVAVGSELGLNPVENPILERGARGLNIEKGSGVGAIQEAAANSTTEEYDHTSPFVFGAGSSGNRKVRKWKKVARVSEKYSFEALCHEQPSKVGFKRSAGIGAKSVSAYGGQRKKSRENEMEVDGVGSPNPEVNKAQVAEGPGEEENTNTAAGMDKSHIGWEPSIALFGTTKDSGHLGQFDCNGRSGGLTLLWMKDECISLLSYSFWHIDVSIGSSDKWRFTGFYRQPDTSRRHESWSLLRSLSHEEFEVAIKKAWPDGDVDIVKKIKACGTVLEDCNQTTFGNLQANIAKKKKEFGSLYVMGASGNHVDLDNCNRELNKLLHQEELLWRQRSKKHWLKEGDKNTRFFHAVASSRKQKKQILSIEDETGNTYTEQTVFQMGGSKAPGPDGMSPLFFQKCWIVSKALTNRLKVILSDIIRENQSAFVPKRMIYDNAMIAFETIHFMRNKRRGRKCHMALKLDLSKAYDRVEWVFLEESMKVMGFPSKWIYLVMQCVQTVSYSVIVNEQNGEIFHPSRGIRQGDPLSPYLFLLCMESFSRLLYSASDLGKIQGVQISRLAPKVSHLFFADDSILFLTASKRSCEEVISILDVFEAASRQKINIEKSAVLFSANTSAVVKDEIMNFLGFRECWIMTRKTVMIQVVAQAIPVYLMSVFLFPKSFVQELNAMIARFWWGSGELQIWDRWINKPPSFRPSPRIESNRPNLKINELMDLENRSWKYEDVLELFIEEDTCRIFSLVVPCQNKEDRLIWNGTMLGEFTVSLAYHVARKIIRKQELPLQLRSPIWRYIWSANVMPIIQYFMWRLVWNILPTKGNLNKRGMEIAETCEVCGGEESADAHVFFNCHLSKLVWEDVCPWVLRCIEQWDYNGSFWEFNLEKAHAIGQFEKICTASWLLWALGNVASTGIGERALGIGRQSVWKPPPSGIMKINTDASFSKEDEQAELGVGIRDDGGSIIASGSRHLYFIADSLYAEVHAIVFGFEMALELGVDRSIMLSREQLMDVDPMTQLVKIEYNPPCEVWSEKEIDHVVDVQTEHWFACECLVGMFILEMEGIGRGRLPKVTWSVDEERVLLECMQTLPTYNGHFGSGWFQRITTMINTRMPEKNVTSTDINKKELVEDMAKTYVVYVDHTPGIYDTWPEAHSQVHGFRGAVHKSFATRQEAEQSFLAY
ncbi:reverse transcriptase [Corchorus capsularis]|uniref:Reverse transcriptase n=1 Tax=Corchorus capsularis TaxID=210143 RepID=A0A1R3K4J5_COCAP|nr:reverse transcriptase [Corchorus capsularis]